MHPRAIVGWLLTSAAIMSPGPGYRIAAQPKPPALAAATHIKCVFPVVSTGTWTADGAGTAQSKPTNLSLEYNAIDVSGGTAETVGMSGNFFITARLILDSLHLLAISDSGPIYLTTVFNRPSHPGKFKAVHSRHEFTDVSLPGFTSRPEQYVGECEILN